MSKVAIIGGRGNGTVILSALEDFQNAGGSIEFVGFLNDTEPDINGQPVIGPITTEGWRSLPDDIMFVYALSNVKQAAERFEKLKALNIPRERFATIVHPSANVSPYARLGRGVVLMPGSVVGPDVEIGDHSQLYAQSFVGHDTVIGQMAFIANNASVGGRVQIGTGAHIGSNSSILERVTVGRFAVIGLGSVVLKDVGDFEVAVGNPARVLRRLDGR